MKKGNRHIKILLNSIKWNNHSTITIFHHFSRQINAINIHQNNVNRINSSQIYLLEPILLIRFLIWKNKIIILILLLHIKNWTFFSLLYIMAKMIWILLVRKYWIRTVFVLHRWWKMLAKLRYLFTEICQKWEEEWC